MLLTSSFRSRESKHVQSIWLHLFQICWLNAPAWLAWLLHIMVLCGEGMQPCMSLVFVSLFYRLLRSVCLYFPLWLWICLFLLDSVSLGLICFETVFNFLLRTCKIFIFLCLYLKFLFLSSSFTLHFTSWVSCFGFEALLELVSWYHTFQESLSNFLLVCYFWAIFSLILLWNAN